MTTESKLLISLAQNKLLPEYLRLGWKNGAGGNDPLAQARRAISAWYWARAIIFCVPIIGLSWFLDWYWLSITMGTIVVVWFMVCLSITATSERRVQNFVNALSRLATFVFAKHESVIGTIGNLCAKKEEEIRKTVEDKLIELARNQQKEKLVASIEFLLGLGLAVPSVFPYADRV